MKIWSDTILSEVRKTELVNFHILVIKIGLI